MRSKALNEELRERSVRTLEIVLTELVKRAGTLPEHFVVTVPKVVIIEQVEFIVAELGRLERALGLADGLLKFEGWVATPRLVLDAEDRSLLPRLPPALLDVRGARGVAAAGFRRAPPQLLSPRAVRADLFGRCQTPGCVRRRRRVGH